MKLLRRLILGCTFLFAAALAPPAFAAAEAELVQANYHSEVLYAYVDFTALEVPLTKADLRIGGDFAATASSLKTLQQTDVPVNCLVLVDISGSMPMFADDIKAFAAQLADGGARISYTLATFGDELQIVSEGLSHAQFAEQLSSLRYNARNTRMYEGLAQAVEHFLHKPYTAEELRSIIIITDALEDSGDVESLGYDALLALLGQAGIPLHAFAVGEDEAALGELEALVQASGGEFYKIAQTGPEQAAVDVLSYFGRLIRVEFPLPDFAEESLPQQISITFASSGEPVCRVEAVLGFLPVSALEVAEEAALPSATPEAALPFAPSESALPLLQEGATASVSETSAGEGWVWLCALAFALACLALLFFLMRRRKISAAPAAPSHGESAPRGVYVRLALERDEFSGNPELELVNSLDIGSDAECGIVLRSPAIAPRHARIFLKDGAIHFENLKPDAD